MADSLQKAKKKRSIALKRALQLKEKENKKPKSVSTVLTLLGFCILNVFLAYFSSIINSTLLFLALPSVVKLDAIGLDSP